ncbi:MAG TPA: ABC transporter ATP-binding protein [Solirubrobacteraceae bacterium]|nr:ABC transporter ATP-binding protein [Solirubrobacteraceae bacterium]
MEDPTLVVDRVSKTFRVPEERTHTLKERALHPLRNSRHESFAALKDVSFAVERGEFFGIVGRNGSGKSTLLKCLAGIYGVDSGRIWCSGRMSTFIELGVGFNPDLAALDNVVMNGIMLGLSPADARSRYERIIEFAELEEFQDLKLKNYSSGMHVRLAFSVAIQVDAEILLIDEVLAVGDAAFQQKCFDVFNRMRDEGRTIIFVTHDMGSVIRFCHRAMLLERGDMVAIGKPEEVADHYLALNFDREGTVVDDTGHDELAAEYIGGHEARILEAWVEDASGERQNVCRLGERVRFCASIAFDAPVEDPAFTIEIEDEWGTKMFIATTAADHERTGRFHVGEEVVLAVEFDNHLSPGKYFPTVNVSHRGSGLDIIHRRRRITSVTVFGAAATGGLVNFPYMATVERSAHAAVSLER